ncbi:hypothetical protein EDC65_5443 [Stella humosa]|uniref:STAS domain-containing protein n=1 Tax=Stella humosa TaxID=94 RepID=A0A3N1KRS4_9PROT|nr:hypothetical protein EDC65_5443 [Stella humosa]
MTVLLVDSATIRLDGWCAVEDAEPLLRLLLEGPGRIVDWRQCDHAHTAVVQILLATRATLMGPPRGTFLRSLVAPAVERRAGP